MSERLSRHSQEVEKIAECLNAAHEHRPEVSEILEAGCGRQWDLRSVAFPYRLTGIDLDAEALRLRKEVAQDLDIAIHGDLTTVEFAAETFDVVYSSYVLEHIRGAEVVLDRFLSWLRPGGSLIVRVPDAHSAYGTITRLSPHWFHVFYYRWMLGKANAGKPGYPPYKTEFDPIVSMMGIERYANTRGLVVAGAYRTAVEVKRGLRGLLMRTALLAVHALSMGQRPASHCTLTYILRKPATSGT